jgi:hypothetical protein
MIRIDIDELRARYEAAFEVFRGNTAKLIERSKGGQLPMPQELAAEEHSLHELTRLRRELLRALGDADR